MTGQSFQEDMEAGGLADAKASLRGEERVFGAVAVDAVCCEPVSPHEEPEHALTGNILLKTAIVAATHLAKPRKAAALSHRFPMS
jgi:hypothetical protein